MAIGVHRERGRARWLEPPRLRTAEELFVPVYVAWQGYSFYADRFDTDDLVLRLAFFAAMLAIAALAVLIKRAGDARLGTGASVALLGGVVLFLLALVATRVVTVSGPRRIGVALKLGTAAVLVALILAEAEFPTLVLAGMAAAVLAGTVIAERALFPNLQDAE